MRAETTLIFGWITDAVMSNIRELVRNGGVLGNDYIWIQYKDGSMFVLDSSWDGERPTLNKDKIEYITTWFYPDAELFVNPKLSKNRIREIMIENTWDEDGEPYYTQLDWRTHRFPVYFQ